MKNFIVIIFAFIYGFSNAQNFAPESISFHQELFVDQGYQNNPPNGYKKSYLCPDSLRFCIIKGQFSDEFEINSQEVLLKLSNNSTNHVIGSIQDKNIPEIMTFGYRETLSNQDAPIFIVNKEHRVKSLLIGDEEIPLNVEESNIDFKIKELPKLEILSVQLFNDITDDNVNIRTGSFSNGKQYQLASNYRPIKGKILCIDANLSNVPNETYISEFAMYDDNSFLSNVFATKSGSRFSTLGSIKNSGYRPTKLYFIVSEDFTSGELFFNDTFLNTIALE